MLKVSIKLSIRINKMKSNKIAYWSLAVAEAEDKVSWWCKQMLKQVDDNEMYILASNGLDGAIDYLNAVKDCLALYV